MSLNSASSASVLHPNFRMSSTSTFSSLGPKFDGSNFPLWSKRFKAWLYAQNVVLDQLLMKSEEAKADDEAAVKSQLKLDTDRTRVYWCLISCLSDSENTMVANIAEGDLVAVWSDLKTRYESSTQSSKVHTRGLMHDMKMNRKEPFDLYKAKLLQCKQRLVAMGESVSDGELLYTLLRGLPIEYELVQKTLEMNDHMTFELACNKIREQQEKIALMSDAAGGNHSAMTNRRPNTNEDYASLAYGRMMNGAGNKNSNFKSRNPHENGGAKSHGTHDNSSSRSANSNDGRCRVCRRVVDHWSRPWDCPSRRGDGNACFICGRKSHQMKDCPEDAENKKEEASMMAADVDDDEYVC